MNTPKILLIGTGPMAYEYSKVLKQMKLDFVVVGRGKESALIFQKKTKITPVTGGVTKFLSGSDLTFDKAIVAVTGNQLGKVTLELIQYGIKSILVEKPGGLDQTEIQNVKEVAEKNSAKVYIAYNRRFYASVKKAQEIIKKDRGVLSYHFEFNELSDQITSLKAPAVIKQNWFLHNSTHIIDLAFFLAGKPLTLQAQTGGSLSWHPAGAIFTGLGITDKNIPFTYHANWLSPGRWGLEIMTKNFRLIFKPLEKLQIQKKGSFEIKTLKIEDKLDQDFKPGLFKEVEAFLNNDPLLCTINEQMDNISIYNKILKGVN